MIRLTDVVHGRDNNFHLLRLAAAAAVLYSHSFPLATGDTHSEPLRASYGCTFGSIAVDLFFLISGMLVTMSLIRRSSAWDFAKARFFRIWPALTVAILLAILVLGPIFTTTPIATYFASKETAKYLVFNLALLKGVAYVLPGVFATNPWPEAINGSLWTLPYEVKCYILLLAIWTLLRCVGQAGHLKWIVAVVWIALFAWLVASMRQSTLEESPARLWLMFCSGASLYLFRDRIVLSGRWLAALAAIVALAAGHGLAFGVAYCLVLPYAMLCAAYLPRGRVLEYNRLGDYSYGVYIYAFPVQQCLMHLWPSLGPIALFGTALASTLVLAVLSWHFVEKPATRLARAKSAPPLSLAPSLRDR
jgi:peptidoglycan/LPS O-acetylase OafA/YrhL